MLLKLVLKKYARTRTHAHTHTHTHVLTHKITTLCSSRFSVWKPS